MYITFFHNDFDKGGIYIVPGLGNWIYTYYLPPHSPLQEKSKDGIEDSEDDLRSDIANCQAKYTEIKTHCFQQDMEICSQVHLVIIK